MPSNNLKFYTQTKIEDRERKEVRDSEKSHSRDTEKSSNLAYWACVLVWVWGNEIVQLLNDSIIIYWLYQS